MDFEWDQGKSDKNLRERGVGFDFAALIFDGPVIERTDSRKNYGEVRIQGIGVAEGIILTVIYTDRGEVRRIISARPASKKERNAWQSFVNH